MRVLAAFDKFKGSVSATEACGIAAAAVVAEKGWDVDECPLSDGGEGFMDILTRAAGGCVSRIPVTGPRGREVEAAFGIVSLHRIPQGARARLPAGGGPGAIAVAEMASASGLSLLKPGERDPLRASSAGTGQLILAAAATRVRAILLGVGGSATSDLGLGALGALGIGFSDGSGGSIESPVPAEWPRIEAIGGQVPGSVPPILIACDVDNPLLGARGAAAVYGPQKGLRPEDAAFLEAQSARIAGIVCGHFGRPVGLAEQPGAGAAGGIAFGLMAGAGARLMPGFELVASWIDLDARLAAADIVLTGEGRFDETSLRGKGPGAVVSRALALGKPVHVFAGEVRFERSVPGLFVHAITPAAMALDSALAEAPALLSRAVRTELRGR
jgi:glycerate kinase